jgi:hypothetical protein
MDCWRSRSDCQWLRVERFAVGCRTDDVGCDVAASAGAEAPGVYSGEAEAFVLFGLSIGREAGGVNVNAVNAVDDVNIVNDVNAGVHARFRRYCLVECR